MRYIKCKPYKTDELNITKIVICVSKPRNHSLTYREKNCRRGFLRPRHVNLEDGKGFRGQGVHNFLCNRKFLIIIKRTSKIYFTVSKYIRIIHSSNFIPEKSKRLIRISRPVLGTRSARRYVSFL
jgi:hypothetical protein